MPYARILTTGSKASCSGGTFADSLTANSGDTFTVQDFNNGGARVTDAWGIDSAHGAEFQWYYTRPDSTHDQVHGFRFQIPALYPGGAGNVAAVNVLRGPQTIDVFSSDTATLQVSATASDAVVLSYITEYDDLPGISASFATWDQVQALKTSMLGVFVNATASGTAGAYGTNRAINADDSRLSANTYYAILGCNVQVPVCTVAITAKAWGNVKVAIPVGVLDTNSDSYFADEAIALGKPLIPIINANDASNVLITVADSAASTTPKIDFLLYELSGQPAGQTQ